VEQILPNFVFLCFPTFDAKHECLLEKIHKMTYLNCKKQKILCLQRKKLKEYKSQSYQTFFRFLMLSMSVCYKWKKRISNKMTLINSKNSALATRKSLVGLNTAHQRTVIPVKNNPKIVAVVDRWSFRGKLSNIIEMGSQNGGRCRQVVAIRRWSLTQVW